jgi:hypothetical protein
MKQQPPRRDGHRSTLSPRPTIDQLWLEQVNSDKVGGMDDPVWMSKTQAQIDAHLRKVWGFNREDDHG